jgi:hypothetical protein
MSTPERPACAALNEYMAEDDHLFDKIRMNFEWDERAFQRLVQISTRCLQEIEHDDMIPRRVASFFGNWIHIIKGMMRHPDFLRLNQGMRTTQENTAYFDEHIEIMKKLVRWMSKGPRPYPAADYVLPGWPPLTEGSDLTASAPARRATPASAPQRPACASLYDHMRGDGRRFENSSVDLEWDEEEFLDLAHLAAQCLKSVEEDDMVPRHVAALCGDWLQDLKRTILDPRFLVRHRGHRTDWEAKDHFRGYIDVIDRLVSWMSNSKHERPPEFFTPSEQRMIAAYEVSVRDVGEERNRTPLPESLHAEATGSTPERPACTALREAMAQGSHLLEKIRVSFEWDEHEFQKLVQVSAQCLAEVEHAPEIPRYVAAFCGAWLHIVMDRLQRLPFRMFNSEGRTRQETATYFDERIEIIRKLVQWMSTGSRPYPADHFIPAGWQSPGAGAIPASPNTPLVSLADAPGPGRVLERIACAALQDHMRGRDRPFEAPSASLEWDDVEFRTLVQLAAKCLEECGHEGLIPRHVARLVGDWLQDLRRTLRDPRFLAQNQGDRTEQQAMNYFLDCASIIERLVSWMATGKRTQSLEHFVPPRPRPADPRMD